jgi:hypothetical protein
MIHPVKSLGMMMFSNEEKRRKYILENLCEKL